MAQGNGLVMPFKPFTPEEVCAITCAKPQAVDKWLEWLGVRTGDVGGQGLDYMQTFGVFVANCFLAEGSDLDRARFTARYLSRMSHDILLSEMKAGRAWPAPNELYGMNHPQGGVMVPVPEGTVGRRLDLRVLYQQFQQQLKRVFPEG